jgi:acylglycerol lipase
MDENVSEILESVHPGESKKFEGIENVSSTWKYLETAEPNPNNVRLFYRLLRLRNHPDALASLCIVHGFAEHSGRMINIGIYFALKGFEVHMIDLRSYGLSGGARCGHNLLEFQKDISLLLQQPRKDLPCFLWGHSMGGLLVTTLCINNPDLNLSGVIVSSPLFETKSMNFSWMKLILIRIVGKYLNEMIFNSYIHPSCLSKDDLYTKNVIQDHKIIPLVGPKLGLSIYEHIKYANKNPTQFSHPVIFFHGDADTLTSMEATQKVYDKCKSLDKTFEVLKGVYHEAHNDVERFVFMDKALSWISRRLITMPMGHTGPLKIGLAGFPQKNKAWKYISVIVSVVYLLIAWKIKVSPSRSKVSKLLERLIRIFWPLSLILS